MVDIKREIAEMDAHDSSSTEGYFDIRYFIGLILLIYGVLLFLYGILAPLDSIRQGINLNFWWGLVLLFVGAIFYFPSQKPKAYKVKSQK